MYRRTMGMMATAMAMMLTNPEHGEQLAAAIKYAQRSKPNHGTPSGAARAKRIARKRKNIRAREKK